MARMRLDKMLTALHCGSRREVGVMVRAGRVMVDGSICRDPAFKVDPDAAQVALDGKTLQYQAEQYYMMNKPAGYITANEDPRHKTVMELVPEKMRQGLFAVGRLDKDTEGLLLFTTDGVWSHGLMSPRRHVEKEYEAQVSGKIEENAESRFAQGLVLKDQTVCLPATLERGAEKDGITTVHVVLREGKYHQVKRMIQAVGGEVVQLRRLRIGSLQLDKTLPSGALRALTAQEKEALGGDRKSDE